MDAQRYARVRELFLAVDDLPPDQQQHFLSAQCGDDQALCAEVLSLLREHDMDLARQEGESAKHPAKPTGASDVATSSGGDQGTPQHQASLGSDSAASAASPFLPGTQQLARKSNRRNQSSGGERANANQPADGRKRTRPLNRHKGNTGATHQRSNQATQQGGQRTQQGAQRTHASPRYRDEPAPKRKPPSVEIWQTRARRHRRFNSGWLWLAVVLPTALIGWWTYAKVQQSLRTTTSNELAGVADSVSSGVRRFLDDQAQVARAVTQQPELREAIVALSEMPNEGDEASPEKLRSAPEAVEIRSQLSRLYPGDEIRYAVWDRTGMVIASWSPDGADVGDRVEPDSAANLARAMRGETVLVGPTVFNPDRKPASLVADLPMMSELIMAEVLPIHDTRGRVVATMLIGGPAMFAHFDDLFRRASAAGGLDVYAVNADGVMVSNSEVAGRAFTVDSERSRAVAGSLRVSDPGQEFTNMSLEGASRQSQPLTYAVAGACSRDQGDRLQPYNNYQGTAVVGAWRWIDDWNIGIIVERSASTAYATAGVVQIGFLSLGLLLTLTALTAAAQIAKRMALAQAAVHPLSRYELVSELGSGGMGVVYLAKHNQLQRDTALKVLRGDRDNLEERLRFDREAKLAASLNSPHTVTIYDYGKGDAGEAYCVMEFLQGITLYDVVARDGYQAYGRVLYILRQICDSLGEAHQLGLVHRDIKPQNVMLSLDPSVGDWAVVFDFGLAKPLQPDADSYQTAETIWAGTPMYMAPERYRDPNTIDPRSDIYSVGCIAYFLMSGRPPFIECDPESLFALVLTEEPISISVHRDQEVPEPIVRLVKRCMAKKVGDRFASIDELAVELDNLIATMPWTVDQARSWWKIHGED